MSLAPGIGRTDNYPTEALGSYSGGGLSFERVGNMIFNRKQTAGEVVRRDRQTGLVQRLVDADEVERRQILLVALQTGELKKSEAADVLKLVDRLVAFSDEMPTD
jgi:hypothetical protein